MSFQKHLMLKVATKPGNTYHQHNSLSRRGLKRVRRVGLIILGSLVGLVGLALLVIYLGSELRLNQRYAIDVTPHQISMEHHCSLCHPKVLPSSAMKIWRRSLLI